LLGDSGVGKTSLFVRLTSGKFSQKLPPTLQMDIGRKIFTVKPATVSFTRPAMEPRSPNESLQAIRSDMMLSGALTAETTPASARGLTTSSQRRIDEASE